MTESSSSLTMLLSRHTRRREFITLLGGAAVAWPLRVFAQERTPVIGFLNTASPGPSAHLVRAFNQGLAEAGYTDGRNVSIEYRWADGQHDRLSALVADLVRQQVSVIAATGGSPSALAAKHATSTIPIVFQVGVDPVAVGLVTSLSQPGANITGATMLAVELGQKRLELLREIVPTATRIAALINPTSPGAAILSRDLRSAAAKLGLQVHELNASGDRDLDSAFQAVAETRSGALLIGADPLFNSRSKRLGELTVHHRVPAIYQFRQFADAGGLISYGGSITDAYRVAGVYTGRILSGEKPSDLPVQQTTKIELIINLKTAKALGLTVPDTLLARADEVIE